jgi:2-furoyl-CoA dehydrogenase large subunit
VTLSGSITGTLGSGRGSGRITLAGEGAGSIVSYAYDAEIGGKVAAVGGRLLDGAARLIIGQFFEALSRRIGGPARPDWRARLRAWLARRA